MIIFLLIPVKGFGKIAKQKPRYTMNIKKKIEELNNSKTPIIVIDKKLGRPKGETLFPEKLARANEIIAKYGLPKIEKQG